ncbi:hypothetical protein KAR91_67855 [Candidatus Pacearchaeota archaeon]|nr:hypothetical protein [Candidatus Pacearchaeota archaeon]
MSYNVAAMNELFVQNLETSEGQEKIAAEGSAFIRKKLREVSFARKIIQPEYVTKADLQRSVQHDGLTKIVDIEPDSKAMTINFRGDADYNYIEGERYEINFNMVSSENFQKTEEELLAYEMPLTQVIEQNSLLDIQKTEDESFLAAIDAAIATEGSAITGSYESDGSIKKDDFRKLFNVLDGIELKTEVLLMDTTMYNRLFLYDATTVGDAVGSETFVNGYKYDTLFGRRLIVSNKVGLLGNKIYGFTAQEFLGNFCVLNDIKFWVKKEKNIITFSSYESIGIGIGNTKACSVMTLS